MLPYILKQIDYYKNAIYHALDTGDHVAALKSRAVQCELENIARLFTEGVSDGNIRPDPEYYYSTKQAAQLLNIDTTNITRMASKAMALKFKNAWYFPKVRIHEEQEKRASQSKRGRRKKK